MRQPLLHKYKHRVESIFFLYALILCVYLNKCITLAYVITILVLNLRKLTLFDHFIVYICNMRLVRLRHASFLLLSRKNFVSGRTVVTAHGKL